MNELPPKTIHYFIQRRAKDLQVGMRCRFPGGVTHWEVVDKYKDGVVELRPIGTNRLLAPNNHIEIAVQDDAVAAPLFEEGGPLS